MAEYQVPEEIKDLFLEGQACEECRNKCIESCFKAKRAIYYAKQARKAYNKAWFMIYELWPETEKGNWQFNFKTGLITKKEI